MIHVGVQALGRPSQVDQILNCLAVVYVAVMPVVLLSDWIALGAGYYRSTAYPLIHGIAALVLVAVSQAVTIPLLATFAMP